MARVKGWYKEGSDRNSEGRNILLHDRVYIVSEHRHLGKDRKTASESRKFSERLSHFCLVRGITKGLWIKHDHWNIDRLTPLQRGSDGGSQVSAALKAQVKAVQCGCGCD